MRIRFIPAELAWDSYEGVTQVLWGRKFQQKFLLYRNPLTGQICWNFIFVQRDNTYVHVIFLASNNIYNVTSAPPLPPLELALQGNLLDCSFRRQIESRLPQWVSGQLCSNREKNGFVR